MSKKINNALKCIPVYLWLIIFTVVPLLMVFFYAIFEVTESGGIRFSLEYLKDAISNPQYLDAMLRSLEYAFFSTLVCLILGYPLAFILSNMEERKRNFVSVLFLLPMWMNFLIRTYALSSLINEQGVVTKFLQWLGLLEGSITGTEAAIIIGMVYNFLPFMILPVYTSMLKIDNRIVEAARDLGADSFTVFQKIVLPLTVPGIISGITMVFVPCITTFVIPQLLNNKVWTIGSLIEFQINGNANGSGGVNNTAAAISFFLMIIVFICMSIFSKFDSDGAENGGLM
ncbi:MAG: ABC transporter permease [Ruminococcaceae bacterium]|nr:ABC transporter permease [Oscillospiraceae bacterium]